MYIDRLYRIRARGVRRCVEREERVLLLLGSLRRAYTVLVSSALCLLATSIAYPETPGAAVANAHVLRANLSAAHVVDVTRDGAGLCNAVSFSQVPVRTDLFIGRIKENTGPDKCSGSNWALALYQMNWDRKSLTFLRYLLRPSFRYAGDGRVIQSVYDGYSVEFQGRLWMAFECAAPESVSSCVVPFDLERGVDPAKVSIPVSGGAQTASDKWRVSASDPKLLVFKDHLYLYWTVIRSNAGVWFDGTTRGTELVAKDGRMWAKSAPGTSVRSDDTERTVEVWSPVEGDPKSDTFADVFGIYTNGQAVLATAGLGGRGAAPDERCLSPAGKSAGCFRVAVAKSSEPLHTRELNHGGVELVDFPQNPQEYSRVVVGPKGDLYMMGMYFNPPEKYAKQYDAHVLPRGLQIFPISTE